MGRKWYCVFLSFPWTYCLAAHWPVLFKDLLLKGWSQNQRVLEFLKGLVDNIKNAKKDLYGMSVVKPTNVALPIFEHIFKTEKSQALNFPIVNDYIQAMLRSTYALGIFVSLLTP